jgi:hypothetical protein
VVTISSTSSSNNSSSSSSSSSHGDNQSHRQRQYQLFAPTIDTGVFRADAKPVVSSLVAGPQPGHGEPALGGRDRRGVSRLPYCRCPQMEGWCW